MGLKRMNYFKGEFLNTEDFKDEQQYHIDMLRAHNKNLHAWGIAEGLDVAYKIGENKVTIRSGMAIDAEGNQIILDKDREEPVPANKSATELYLTIYYHDEPTDSRNDNPEKPENTRIEAKPKIKFYGIDESFDQNDCLILGKVVLDEKKNISEVDLTERTRAGIKGDLSAGSITLSVENVAPKQFPKLKGLDADSLEIDAKNKLQVNSDQTSLTGSLTVNGKAEATAFIGDGSSISFDIDRGHKHSGTAGDGPKISHSNLDNVLAANTSSTSTDAVSNKHVSDSLAKGWQDHIMISSGNPHGVTAAQLSDYLRQSIVFVNFTRSDGDDTKRREKIGFVPKLVLISGGFQVELGEAKHGGTFSGFWANGSTGCSYPMVYKYSPTDVQIYSQTERHPFHIYVYYNDSSRRTKPQNEAIYGTIDFLAEDMVVTLHRSVQGKSDPIDSFSISLCMLCIG